MKKQTSNSTSFVEWLKAVPDLRDLGDNEEITIDIPISADVPTWIVIARLAASHGDSLVGAVNKLLNEASAEDCCMNRQIYPSEEQTVLSKHREALVGN